LNCRPPDIASTSAPRRHSGVEPLATLVKQLGVQTASRPANHVGCEFRAPSIASAFHYFGANAARTDVAKLKPARPIPGVTVAPTAAQLAAKPSPLIDKMSRQYLAALPGHADSGKPVTRPFASVSEMRAYAKERSDAAQAYIAAKRMAQR
jgi:hypothetical protein